MLLKDISESIRRPKKLNVIVHPNPLLKSICAPVDIASERNLKPFIKDMIKTMRAEEGVGLAAVQVGVFKRLLVFDDSEDQDNPRALINPVIVARSEEKTLVDEGCLSFPGVYFPVERHAAVVVEAIDENGAEIQIEATDFLSRVLQHEIDHLDGIMILERATPEVRQQALREYFAVGKDPV